MLKELSTKYTKKSDKNIKNNIFREYEKKSDKFIATNKFFVSLVDNDKIEFNSFDINSLYQKNNIYEKFTQYSKNENIYISNNNNFSKKYIELFIVSEISFTLEDININKIEILKKIMENDNTDGKLLDELYYNKDFSEKINIELPKKYDNKKIILEDVNINKKYLFKINFTELNNNFCQVNKLLY